MLRPKFQRVRFLYRDSMSLKLSNFMRPLSQFWPNKKGSLTLASQACVLKFIFFQQLWWPCEKKSKRSSGKKECVLDSDRFWLMSAKVASHANIVTNS